MLIILFTGYTEYTVCYATICIASHCFVIFWRVGWMSLTPRRMAWREALGVTGPTTLLLLCVPLRMSWVCRLLWVSGSSWAFFRWQRWELQATSSDWVKAWSHFYARNDGIYYTGNHRQIPWLLVSFCWLEVCRRAQWSCRNLQSASSRLGSDFGLHGLLRSFPGPVCWNSCCSWWLWMEAHHIYWSGSQENKAQCRVGKRKTGDDGHHWHVLSGDGWMVMGDV